MDTKKIRRRLVKTPQLGIPIGEAYKRPDGSHAIRIKKAGCKDTEEITLDHLVALVVVGSENHNQT